MYIQKHCLLTVLLFWCIASTSFAQNKDLVLLDSLSHNAFENKDYEKYFKYFIQYENNITDSGDKSFQVQSLYRHSEHFFRLGIYQQSRDLALKVIAIDHDIDHLINATFTSLSYVNLAKSFNALNRHEQAKETYFEAIHLAKNIGNHEKPLRLASAYNNLGLQYLDYEKNQDSALYYFQEAKEVMNKFGINSHPFYGILNENLAHIEFNHGHYEKAKAYYQTNYDSVFTLNSSNERIRKSYFLSGIYLAKTYLNLHQTSKAKKILRDIKVSLDTIEIQQFKQEVEISWLEVSKNVSKKELDYKQALYFSEELEIKKDSLHQWENKNKLLGNNLLTKETVSKYQTLLENERLKLINTQQKNRARLWIAISVLSILLGFFLFVYIRYKQRLINIRKNKELAEQKALAETYKNQLLTQDLENQKQDLTNIALSTQQNISWLEDLEMTISQYKKQGNFKKENFLNELQDAIDDKKRLNTFTDNFHDKIATINSEFYSKLENKHPELTDYDIKLCALIRINLESKDIATILNISPASVNTSRYRLRKKLNLNKDTNLTSYLKNM